jgi:uncharacterized membrane protein
MRTPAQVAGHPIHPMLVTIPIGLWLFSLVCDFIALQSAEPETWAAASLYAMVGGLIGALAAGLPGLIDLVSLKDSAIRGTALKHMGLNLVVVVLFAINAWTRYQGTVSAAVSVGLSIIAIALLLVSGWLGGKMVYEAGVAVHADESAAPLRTDWGSRSRGWTSAAPPRGERAMASDAGGPSRDAGTTRPDKPAADSTEFISDR